MIFDGSSRGSNQRPKEITYEEYSEINIRPEKQKKVKYRYTATKDGSKCVNYFAQISPDSWINYNIDAQAKPVFIKELNMSPIDIEITFRTRVIKADGSRKIIDE